MTSEDDLRVIRRAYAKQILAVEGVRDPRLEDAFAAVRREDFLGPGPWPMFRFDRGYTMTPDADTVYLYTNDLFGIAPERHLNNGLPSLHAHLLRHAALREGEHAVHVGAGVGYYTAIMAELVGPRGRVTGIEFDPGLAARAERNLARYANTRVIAGDGAAVQFDPADVIYVNAGATHPVPSWLDRLEDGGRLVLPLTTDDSFRSREPGFLRRGAVFLITRRGEAFDARWISGVAIFPCEGAREAASARALAAAFEKEDWKRVTRLYRTGEIPDERCWLKASDWCLAYE